MKGKANSMQLGFSHEVNHTIPKGVEVKVAGAKQEIKISGIDKQLVGEIAAEIRRLSSAGALQGQGRPLRGRIGPPQGRQEEVGHGAHRHQIAVRTARAHASAARSRRGQRASASVGLPFVKNIYAQVIDDERGVTLAAASTLEKD